MFKLFATAMVFFLCLSFGANAKTIKCISYAQFKKASGDLRKEKIAFAGKISPKIAGVLYLSSSGLWTFAYVTKDKEVCVVGFGTGGKHFSMIFKPKP